MKGITRKAIILLLAVVVPVLAQDAKRFRLGEPKLWRGSEIDATSDSSFKISGDGKVSLRYHFCSNDFTFSTDLKVVKNNQIRFSLYEYSRKSLGEPVWTFGLYLSPDVQYPRKLSSNKPYIALDLWREVTLNNESQALRVDTERSKSLIRSKIKDLPKGEEYSVALSSVGGLLKAIVQNEYGDVVTVVDTIKDVIPKRKVIAVETKGEPEVIEPLLVASDKGC